ncbi:MAG: methyltransferase domain-containing protein [Geobacteraceae bacterium]|nr:methyltransferase domain-containing protein [Geobacteraceae bacterium]
MKLNLGCGNKRKEGFTGIDRYQCDAVDIICDVTTGIPFEDSSVVEVYMDNFIEHILDIPALMQEVVRISRPGARITIITPHFTSLSSWRDPTHVHHLSYFSFDHFTKPSTQHYVGGRMLRIICRKLSFSGGIFGLFGRFLFALSPYMYEQKFCFIFRASTLTFELEVTDQPMPASKKGLQVSEKTS